MSRTQLFFRLFHLIVISMTFMSLKAKSLQFDNLETDPVATKEENKEDLSSESDEDSSSSSLSAPISAEEIRALHLATKAGIETQMTAAAAKILGRDPQNLVALNALGLHYYKKNYLGLAKMIFRRALSSHPKEPALHNNLGIVYLAEGDQRASISSFKKSLEVRPNYVIGATNLASIYLEYKDFNRALAPLEGGYKVTRSGLRDGKEESVGVANNLAVALSAQGETKQARDIYEEINRGTSRNMTVLLNYAILLTERLKSKDEALKAISKVKFVADDPKIIRKAEELEKKLKSVGE